MATKKDQQTDDKSFIIDMPDVSDIPGQENVIPPRIREMEDVTISSADEEGEGILDEVNTGDAPLTDGIDTLGSEEKKALRRSGHVLDADTKNLDRRKLDQTDGEDVLNETSNPLDFGGDLDVPGSEQDDANEEIGEEDEENNSWSS